MGADLGRQLRLARLSAGLSQRLVARLIGLSQAQVSRIERGRRAASVVVLATFAAVVGLDLSVKLFPGGSPVRDAASAHLLGRLQKRLPDMFRWASEVPIPLAGDQRGIDAMIVEPAIQAGFELESRLLDGQAVARRAALKQRDAGLTCMVLVLSDTIANREAMAAAGPTLRAAFPLEGRAVLKALRSGETPAAGGIVFV